MSPPRELTRTIRPPPCRRIGGSAALTRRAAPQKFVSSWSLADAMGVFSTGPDQARSRHTNHSIEAALLLDDRCDATPHRSSSSTSIFNGAQPPEEVPRRLAPNTVQPLVEPIGAGLADAGGCSCDDYDLGQ